MTIKRKTLPASALLAATLLLATGCNSSNEITPPPSNSKWISRIVEYRPAPGQFINSRIGTQEAAEALVGGKSGTVSLGGFGGYIVFEFDHAVRNIDGPDFVIHGNAFDTSSEPGIVLVSSDGTMWYELRGSEYADPQTDRNYTVTYYAPSQTQQAEAICWEDSRGNSGELEVTVGNAQSYWPLSWAEGKAEISFTGVALPPNAVWQGNKYVLQPYEYGYADNYSSDYGDMVGSDSDTRNSNKFDLDWAVDASGNPVSLTSIRLVKVYTAMNQQVGAQVGETSTEICGAISLSANL